MFDFDFTGMIGKASAVQKVFDKLIDLDVLENGMDAGFRFYQKEMWEKFLEIFHGSEEAGMFQAATGTGKTEVFKFFIPYLLCNAEVNNDKEGKVFGIVCHRHSLINDLNRRMLPILFNKYYDDEKPWILYKENTNKFNKVIYNCTYIIANLSNLLEPVMPNSSEILSKYLNIDITKWKPVEIQKEIILDNILPLFERIK